MSLDETVAAAVAAMLERALPQVVDQVAERVAAKLAANPKPANQAPTSPEKYLSLPKAAAYLGVGESTMRGYVKAKRLPYSCPNGTRYKFKQGDLEEFKNQAPQTGAKGKPVSFAAQSVKNIQRALGNGK